MSQAGLSFEAGETYTFAAWLKTEDGKKRTIRIAGEQNHDPWDEFGPKDITITDEWAEYYTTWTQGENDNKREMLPKFQNKISER